MAMSALAGPGFRSSKVPTPSFGRGSRHGSSEWSAGHGVGIMSCRSEGAARPGPDCGLGARVGAGRSGGRPGAGPRARHYLFHRAVLVLGAAPRHAGSRLRLPVGRRAPEGHARLGPTWDMPDPVPAGSCEDGTIEPDRDRGDAIPLRKRIRDGRSRCRARACDVEPVPREPRPVHCAVVAAGRVPWNIFVICSRMRSSS